MNNVIWYISFEFGHLYEYYDMQIMYLKYYVQLKLA